MTNDAELKICQQLITNLRGWVTTGKSEHAASEIDRYWQGWRERQSRPKEE